MLHMMWIQTGIFPPTIFGMSVSEQPPNVKAVSRSASEHADIQNYDHTPVIDNELGQVNHSAKNTYNKIQNGH